MFNITFYFFTVMDEITIWQYLADLMEVCALGVLSKFGNQLYHMRGKNVKALSKKLFIIVFKYKPHCFQLSSFILFPLFKNNVGY